MPKLGKFYGLDITIQPVEIKDNGTRVKMGTTTQSYSAMDYDEMVVGQKVAITALVEAFTKLGMDIFNEKKGQGSNY